MRHLRWIAHELLTAAILAAGLYGIVRSMAAVVTGEPLLGR